MSRSVSLTAKQALFASETSEAFLILITIDHVDIDPPIRATSDAVNTVSNGNTFIPYPFELILPDDTEQTAPRASLRIDNIDREIVKSIRAITSAPTILMEIVLASDPNTVEATLPDFEMTRVGYDFLTVDGDLTLEEYETEPYPGDIFSPAQFPALF